MASAVLLHPHPDMGGNQFNNVITALYERLAADGITGHRFDFESSDPARSHEQARATIEEAAAPVYLVGYSYGGAVAAALDHPAIAGWGLIAPGFRLIAPTIGADPRPKLVVTGERDPWVGPAAIDETTASWAATERAVVPGADHFFGGADAAAAAELVAAWIRARG
jgi:alpha/beta superfamily hydrolase